MDGRTYHTICRVDDKEYPVAYTVVYVDGSRMFQWTNPELDPKFELLSTANMEPEKLAELQKELVRIDEIICEQLNNHYEENAGNYPVDGRP